MKKRKILFRGAFNFHGSARIMYRAAYTKKQAWAIMCREIAKKDGVNAVDVMAIFDGSRDNFKIEEEK